ncbi:MAG: toxin-antitoxin system protein [Gemmatimonadetes bacterium]|nr:toxin-antitoxin system protein [Gemmatimonadota bacterium]
MPQTRISDWGHQTLRNLARETGQTSEQILDRALSLLERERLLDAINAGYLGLKADSSAWAVELAERNAWDATLADGAPE